VWLPECNCPSSFVPHALITPGHPPAARHCHHPLPGSSQALQGIQRQTAAGPPWCATSFCCGFSITDTDPLVQLTVEVILHQEVSSIQRKVLVLSAAGLFVHLGIACQQSST
jgi:hypothetical protein